MVFTRSMSTRHGQIRKFLALVATVPLLLAGALAAAAPGPDSTSGPTEETTVVRDGTSGKATPKKVRKAHKGGKAKARLARKKARGGSRVGYELLPTSGTGYYHYAGGDDPTKDVWGRPGTINCVEDVARKWATKYPKRPRLGIGDISLKNGGRFRPHKSHRKGVDIDIRPLKGRGEGPVSVGQPSYSRKYTQDMIALFIETCDVKRVYFNDITISRKMDKVATHPGHHNHVHISIRPSKDRAGLLASSSRRSAPAASYK